MSLDPQATSTVAMTNEEWQVALAVLREGPYKVVAQIIEKIVSQCTRQAIEHVNADRAPIQ